MKYMQWLWAMLRLGAWVSLAGCAINSWAVEGFPRQIIDASGEVLHLNALPQRIVSQTLATDELLLALVAPERIAAVSVLAKDPQYSNIATRADLPPILNSDPEQVLNVHPDLVLVANYSRAETVALLRASGAPVFKFAAFQQLTDIIHNIKLLGQLTGTEIKAAALIAEMQRRLMKIAEQVPKLSPPPRILSFSQGYTAGKATLFDDLLQRLGAVNVAAEQGIHGNVFLNEELLPVWQPSIILVLSNAKQNDVLRQELLAKPAIALTLAAQQQQIKFIPKHTVLAVSHYIINGLVDLAEVIYNIKIVDELRF